MQDFIPLPMDVATCMYYTGIDPTGGGEVYVPKGARMRRWQRALLQYFKPENYATVREALRARPGPRGLDRPGPECLMSGRGRRGGSEDNRMFTPDQYQLLDFGEGRRLERFGEVTLDRPCPAAERITRADPAAWPLADARFDAARAPRGNGPAVARCPSSGRSVMGR